MDRRVFIYPAAFGMAIAATNTSLGIVFHARETFGASPSRIGLLGASLSCAYILGCIAVRLSGVQPGAVRSIGIALSLVVFADLGQIFAPHLVWLFFFYALLGFSLCFFWPPLMGWLSADAEGHELGRSMGWFNVCWSSGTIVGPFLAGLASQYSRLLPLVISLGLHTLLLLFLVVCALRLKSGEGVHTGTSGDVSHDEEGRGLGTGLRYPCWIGLAACYAVVGVLLNVFPVAAREEFGLSKTSVGILLLVRALATTAGLGILGRTAWWHFKGRQLWLGYAGFALICILFSAFISFFALIVLFCMAGLFAAHGYANSLFHGVAGSRSRPRRMAVHESLLSVGMVLGSALGGMIYEHTSYRSLFLSCAWLLGITALIVSVLVQKYSGTARELRPVST